MKALPEVMSQCDKVYIAVVIQTLLISTPSKVSLDRSMLISDGGSWTAVMTMCEWCLRMTISLMLFSYEFSLFCSQECSINMLPCP